MPNHKVQMPEVEVYPSDKMREIFANARSLCSVKSGFLGLGTPERQVSLITPGRMIAQIPCPKQGSMNKDAVKSTEAILPAKPQKEVVAIAYTELKALMNGSVIDAQTVSNVIPFLGFLLGFSYIGHNVVIFEGHSSALAIGLKGADMVLVDELMAPHLRKDFVDIAYKVMRTPLINIYRTDGRVDQIKK